MKKYTGFIAPHIDETHWILGASNTPVFPTLKEDGNWEHLLPDTEKQTIRGIETFNCTGFNTLNAIEILMYQLTGERYNYSDRWLGIIAGTKTPGNDPHIVAEAIRKYGLIPEAMLPFSDEIKDINEYYSFKGGDKEACYAEGKKWLAKYDFKHSWAFTPGQPVVEQLNNMKIALKNSPLCIAVYAWASNDKDVYYSLGQPNHWTAVYGTSDYLKIFDSYEPFKKLVDQNILYCKRYSIELKTQLTQEQILSFWQQIKNLWDMIFQIKRQMPPVAPVKNTYEEVKETIQPTQNKISEWAKAIAKWEGDTSGTNPGNLKFAPLTESLGATKGRKGSDGGYFCKFPTYDIGFHALCTFLEMACKDQLLSYHSARTFETFTHIYAGNPPRNYIEGIRKILGCQLTTNIATFL